MSLEPLRNSNFRLSVVGIRTSRADNLVPSQWRSRSPTSSTRHHWRFRSLTNGPEAGRRTRVHQKASPWIRVEPAVRERSTSPFAHFRPVFGASSRLSWPTTNQPTPEHGPLLPDRRDEKGRRTNHGESTPLHRLFRRRGTTRGTSFARPELGKTTSFNCKNPSLNNLRFQSPIQQV